MERMNRERAGIDQELVGGRGEDAERSISTPLSPHSLPLTPPLSVNAPANADQTFFSRPTHQGQRLARALSLSPRVRGLMT
jgi:hypothetical protein